MKVKTKQKTQKTQILTFTTEEIMALYEKLKYKENSVWVMLRDKIDDQVAFCPHCGITKEENPFENIFNWDDC